MIYKVCKSVIKKKKNQIFCSFLLRLLVINLLKVITLRINKEFKIIILVQPPIGNFALRRIYTFVNLVEFYGSS